MRLDLRAALRAMTKSPGFFIGSVLTLALGLGAVTTAFGLLFGALGGQESKGLDDRVVLYLTEQVQGRESRMRWPYAAVRELRDSARSFDRIASYTIATLNLTGLGDSSRIDIELVSPSYFEILGKTPLIGRATSGVGDEKPGEPSEVVIGYALWQRALGGTPDALGKTIRLARESLTVVGVMPPGVRGLSGRADAWVPHTMAPRMSFEGYFTSTEYFHNVIAKLASGVGLREAQGEMNLIGARIGGILPPRSDNATNRSATVVSLREAQTNSASVRARLYIAIGAVLVMLVAGVNLANLVATRVRTRQREFAVRLAVGAGRLHVIRSVAAEMLLVAVAGFGLAMAFAAWTRDLVVWMMPATLASPGNDYGQIASFASLAIDARVMATVAGIAVAVMAAASALATRPALRASLVSTLKSGSDRGSTRGPSRSERTLLALQVAASISLVASAGLVLRSVGELDRVDPGFDSSRMVAFSVAADLADQRPGAGALLAQRLIDGLADLRGVEELTVGQCTPYGSRCARLGLAIEGRPETEREPLVSGWHRVGPGHFQALGIPVISGRDFTRDDRRGRSPVVAINQTAARRFFPNQDPIGRRVRLPQVEAGDPDMAEIIAVVGDVLYWPLDQAPGPDVYQPALQFALPFTTVMARVSPGAWRESSLPTAVDQPIFTALRQAMNELDPNLPMFNAVALDDLARAGRADRRFISALLTACALLALALAAVGIYSLTAGLFQSRRKELGVRLALGASPHRLVQAIMAGALIQTLVGVAIGTIVALGAGRLMRGVLFGIGPNDPSALGLAAIVMLSVAGLASWLPARRALRIDPAEQLRAE
jgi:putative ABC transport system permease protein